MMDDGEMKRKRDENNNLGTSGHVDTEVASYTVNHVLVQYCTILSSDRNQMIS